MTISKVTLRSKLDIKGRLLEQVMEFNYLGVNITISGNLAKEIITQAQKAARMVGCLKDLV